MRSIGAEVSTPVVACETCGGSKGCRWATNKASKTAFHASAGLEAEIRKPGASSHSMVKMGTGLAVAPVVAAAVCAPGSCRMEHLYAQRVLGYTMLWKMRTATKPIGASTSEEVDTAWDADCFDATFEEEEDKDIEDVGVEADACDCDDLNVPRDKM